MNKIFEEYFKGKRFLIQGYRETPTLATYLIWDMNSRFWNSLLGHDSNEPIAIYQGILEMSNEPLVEYELEFLGAIVEYLQKEMNQAKKVIEEEDILKDYQIQLSSLKGEEVTIDL